LVQCEALLSSGTQQEAEIAAQQAGLERALVDAQTERRLRSTQLAKLQREQQDLETQRANMAEQERRLAEQATALEDWRLQHTDAVRYVVL
jgi:hypothetical protein